MDAVLVFDECESLFGTRSESASSSSDRCEHRLKPPLASPSAQGHRCCRSATLLHICRSCCSSPCFGKGALRIQSRCGSCSGGASLGTARADGPTRIAIPDPGVIKPHH